VFVNDSAEDGCSSARMRMWQALSTSSSVMKSVSVTAVGNASRHCSPVVRCYRCSCQLVD